MGQAFVAPRNYCSWVVANTPTTTGHFCDVVPDLHDLQADLHEKLWAAVRHGGCDGFLEIPKTRPKGFGFGVFEGKQQFRTSL